MRGVAAQRSAQRACERSSDWGRGCAVPPRPGTRRYEVARYFVASYACIGYAEDSGGLMCAFTSGAIGPIPDPAEKGAYGRDCLLTQARILLLVVWTCQKGRICVRTILAGITKPLLEQLQCLRDLRMLRNWACRRQPS